MADTVYLFVADQDYWYEQARIALRKRLQYATDRRPHAKNVLLFVGDGMGVATATAARILGGQRMGKSGEEHELAWDTFPTVAMAKVNRLFTQKLKRFKIFLSAAVLYLKSSLTVQFLLFLLFLVS